MKTKFAALIMAACMALGLTGCGDIDITKVGLPANVTVEKGETYLMTVSYGTDDATAEDAIAEAVKELKMTWTSSNESVATVDAAGLVTAVTAGETDITVTLDNAADVNSTSHVTVVVSPTGIIAPDTLNLEINGESSKNLAATATPEDATGVKLAYTSSDTSIATVDENGLVTAVSNGTCSITTSLVASGETVTAENAAPVDSTVTSEDADSDQPATMPDASEEIDPEMSVVPEGMCAETKVTVTTAVTGIALDNTEGILYVGNTFTVNASVQPADASNANTSWTSSDESVATVDNGKITAKATGTATITASIGDITATYSLTVTNKPVATASPKTTVKANNGKSTGTSSNSGSVSNGSAGGANATTPVAPAPDTSTPAAPAPAPETPSEPAPAPAPEAPSNNGSYTDENGVDHSPMTDGNADISGMGDDANDVFQ